jgi:hypothetical protein
MTITITTWTTMIRRATLRPVTAAALLILAGAAALSGCRDDGALEEAGEEMDEAVEEAGDAIEDAGDRIEDATDPLT